MEVGTSTGLEEGIGILRAGIIFVGVVVAMVTGGWEVRGDEMLYPPSELQSGPAPAESMDWIRLDLTAGVRVISVFSRELMASSDSVLAKSGSDLMRLGRVDPGSVFTNCVMWAYKREIWLGHDVYRW